MQHYDIDLQMTMNLTLFFNNFIILRYTFFLSYNLFISL